MISQNKVGCLHCVTMVFIILKIFNELRWLGRKCIIIVVVFGAVAAAAFATVATVVVISYCFHFNFKNFYS